jgi:hypothetical protein
VCFRHGGADPYPQRLQRYNIVDERDLHEAAEKLNKHLTTKRRKAR